MGRMNRLAPSSGRWAMGGVVLYLAMSGGVGCGTGPATGTGRGPGVTNLDEGATNLDEGATNLDEGQAGAVDSPAGPCVGLDEPRCADNPSCVFDPTCRSASNACEGVEPAQLPGGYGRAPDFGRGDPCAAVDPSCAFDLSRSICVPFVAPSACPQGRDAAAAMRVHCMHPGQEALECPFDGGSCSCTPPPPYCGGMAPHPLQLNQPTTWACVDDVGADGCPRSPITAGSRCDLSEAQQCLQGCSSLYRCVGRRWQLTELPPRP